MNLAQRIAKNSGTILTGQILNMGLNLAVMVLLARYLGEERFGMFSFAMVFVGIFAIFANFGMKPIVVREISRDRTVASKILGTSFEIKILFSFLSILLAIAVAILLRYSPELIFLVTVLSLNIFFSSKLQTFRVLFESVYEANLAMQLPILFRLVDAILLLGLVGILINIGSSLRTITIIYVLSTGPGFLLTAGLSIKQLKPDFHFDLQQVRWILQESLPLALYVALTRLHASVDVFVLKTLKGDTAVGYYSAAFRLVYPFSFIPAAITMSLFPLMSRFYKDSRKKLITSFSFGFKILVLIGIALGLSVTFMHRRIILLLYTERYLPAAWPLAILMWSELFVFLTFFLVDYHTSVNRQKRNTTAILIMLLINIVLNIMLVPKWGTRGASTAKLVTTFIGFTVLYASAYRETKISILSVVWRCFPICVLYSTWLFFARQWNLYVLLILSPLIFISLVFLFRFFTRSETKYLKELFTRT